jgi:hypothetical protein
VLEAEALIKSSRNGLKTRFEVSCADTEKCGCGRRRLRQI